MIEKVILGSSSPRRKEILNFFSLPFEVAASDFDESKEFFQGNPHDFATTVAEKKGHALTRQFPSQVIITADTVVYFEEKLLFKPKDEQDARHMLKSLSGKTHTVITGVGVCKGSNCFSESEATLVTFNQLTDKQIETYLQTTHPMDKAGSYGIQEVGSLLVSHIEGSFYNVVGLPVNPLSNLLAKVGIDLWDAIGS